MGTPYSLIYKRAITEFKDPTLKQLLSNNSILFFEVMYNYLENAISLFTNPISSVKKLQDRTGPILIEEKFVGDNKNNSFTLQEYPNKEQYDECVIECTVNGDSVEYQYDFESHTVTVNDILTDKDYLTVSWYFIGNFISDLDDEEIYILQQFVLACWSEYIYNDKLDVIRLLGDTDFKLPANGTTTMQKVSWNIVNRETVTKRMNHYAWMKSLSKWGNV